MSRKLDHLVLCNRDLDQAAAAYQALGFTLTPRAVHPFGTCNRLVQLANCRFLEIVAIHDAQAIAAHQAPRHFSFAAQVQAYLQRQGEGFCMLVLAGSDARADVAEFRAKGLDTYDAFDFGRDAQLPDGSVARVGFSLAFVTHPEMTDTAFFTCQQRHPPELFWKPEYQRHANTAQGVVEVIMAAEEPSRLADFFARLTDAPALGEAEQLTFGPPGDQLTLLSPQRLLERFPESAGALGEPAFKAYRLNVSDLAVTRTCLAQANIPARDLGTSVIVGPAHGQGVVIEFSQA